MIVCEKQVLLQDFVEQCRRDNCRIGFVPTMGALHDGHQSLVKVAREQCDKIVMSIFINPTQFDDVKDFEAYPQTLDSDLLRARNSGVDAVFLPQVEELYGVNLTVDSVNYGALTHTFEGEKRQGHFDGVVAVVRKLFHAVSPDAAFFGEKDLQQLAVIRRLAEEEFQGLEIVGCPLIRETDGLAMSSRNIRLNSESRNAALQLHRWIFEIKEGCRRGQNVDAVLQSIIHEASNNSEIDLEYLDLVDGKTFQVRRGSELNTDSFAVVAAKVGGVRLIDNCRIVCS